MVSTQRRCVEGMGGKLIRAWSKRKDTCNPSTPEAEAGDHEFKSGLGQARPCLKNKIKQNKS
jgi:hypothetical protein